MGQTSNVYAVAMMADGRVLFAQKEVKVTLGGCADEAKDLRSCTAQSARKGQGRTIELPRTCRPEPSFGKLGPSLYQHGKLRGVGAPATPAVAPIVQYTWGKLWNSKPTTPARACRASAMPAC